MILAVTVLTGLDQTDLVAVGVAATPAEQVMRLARLAIEAGADRLVCSPLEVAMLRQALGPAVASGRAWYSPGRSSFPATKPVDDPGGGDRSRR